MPGDERYNQSAPADDETPDEWIERAVAEDRRVRLRCLEMAAEELAGQNLAVKDHVAWARALYEFLREV